MGLVGVFCCILPNPDILLTSANLLANNTRKNIFVFYIFDLFFRANTEKHLSITNIALPVVIPTAYVCCLFHFEFQAAVRHLCEVITRTLGDRPEVVDF